MIGRVAISGAVTWVPGGELPASSSAWTVKPVRVVVAAMLCTTTSWLVSGLPRRFIVMWLKRAGSIRLHLGGPGGTWHTVIARPVSAASAAGWPLKGPRAVAVGPA